LSQKPPAGLEGSGFDNIVHAMDRIEKIHSVMFVLLLFFMAMVSSRGQWIYGFGLWSFMLLDWLLVSMLPRLGRSFGPAKPPTFLLAIMRCIFGLLPVEFSLVLQFIGTFLVVYGFYYEPLNIRITHQKLTSSRIKSPGTLKLMHLGDLHIERLTQRESQIQAIIDEQKPDLILFSGDTLNLSYLNDPEAWSAARKVIEQWKAPSGVYLVTGSPAVDLPGNMPSLLNELPINWLQDEIKTITFNNDHVNIIGLSCTHYPAEDNARLEKLVPNIGDSFTILLHHSPDLAPDAAHFPIDLQLSGHTHGGQVRIPFLGAIFTASTYGKRFESGRYQVDDMVLYVTRGLGMEGASMPRIRFLCPPEIILWEISAEIK
jgi:predicted MPP superfamily phosphohydrolase